MRPGNSGTKRFGAGSVPSSVLRFGRCVIRRVACQLPDDKFLQKIVRSARANGDEGVIERHGRIAIRSGIIEIGDAACGEAAEDTGVIWLPVSIVAFADNGVGDRIGKRDRLLPVPL